MSKKEESKEPTVKMTIVRKGFHGLEVGAEIDVLESRVDHMRQTGFAILSKPKTKPTKKTETTPEVAPDEKPN